MQKEWFSPKVSFEIGMTAIGAAGTDYGFVMAADGRKTVGHNVQDDCRKIFTISDSVKLLMYAATGVIGDTHGFDLLQAIRAEVDGLSGRAFKDCYHYLRTLGGKINKAINDANQAGTLKKLPETDKLEQSTAWKIVRIFVAGYFAGDMCLFHVDFFHFSHKPSAFLVVPCPSPKFSMLSGSEVVRKEMYPDDGAPVPSSPFAQYIHPLSQKASLDDAEQYITGYIEACSTPLALQMDAATCRLIGGHIHVAEITPNGFRWRREPAPHVPTIIKA